MSNISALTRRWLSRHSSKALGLTMLFACQAYGGYELDNQSSSVNFVSIKKLSIAEVHHFEELYGTIDDNGNAQLTIALDSVESNITIRNQRMQQMLFNTSVFPTVQFKTKIAIRDFDGLKSGKQIKLPLRGTLTLNGQKQTIDANVLVTKMANGGLHVVTTKPIIINSKDFKLDAGIDALRDIAGLPNINYAVPVSLNLVFNRQPKSQ